MNKQDLIDFELRIKALFEQGKLPYLIHLCGGNEDQLIEIFKDIKPDDWIFSSHRSHYHYLLAGGDSDVLEQMIREGRSHVCL
jgi:TPP-dependent pyruvate/acetoin dehydrogenase alpha subunit